MLYPILKNYKYGFINSEGEVIVKPIYSYIGCFSEDRCVVGKSEESRRLRGYIDSTGEIIIPLRHISYFSDFSEGLAQYAYFKEKVGFIDRWGNVKIAPQFEADYEGEGKSGFSEGIAAVATLEGCIYIDTDGKQLFDTQFEIARRFQNGYGLVQPFSRESNQPKRFFIDRTGKELKTIPCKINILCQGFRNGLCEVTLPPSQQDHKLNRIGFIDTNGNLAFESRFFSSSGFHKGLCTVKKAGGKSGVIDTKGNWVIEPKYDDIGLFSNGIAPFRKNRKWGLLNSQGEVILSPRFYIIRNFTGNCSSTKEVTTALIQEDSETNKPPKEVYINRTGEIVMPFDISDN